jgi:hypothetical protein
MSRIGVLLTLIGFLLGNAGTAIGIPIHDPWSEGEENLYEIWNYLFDEDFTSSQDLYQTYGVGFEALVNLGDQDYSDLVVLVDAVVPIRANEPATFFMLGSGLLLLAGLRRKFRRGT